MKEIKNLREENKYLKERLNSLLSQNEYGLKWKDYKEENEEVKYTVIEDKEMEIKTNSQNQIEHLFFEGDNLLALRELSKTHKEKIDVIYIDPPYNTGNEFVYNDRKQDEQGDKHSAWLSFMSKRLEIARELLTEDGVIFISIDDNEQAHLKLLMSDIYGENNHVGTLVWENKEGGGGSDSKFFRIKHEYIHMYVKNREQFIKTYPEGVKKLPITDEDRYRYRDKYYKERGKYQLQKLDVGSLGYVPSLDFPIQAPCGEIIFPNKNREKVKRWRWSREKVQWGVENGFIEFKEDSGGKLAVYTKQYMNVDNKGKTIKRGHSPLGVISEYSTTQSAKFIRDIFNGKKVFDYTKPVALIKYLLDRINSNSITVLDFFAGSGTTGHAVMELNKEDNGERQFILCTTNEVSEKRLREYLHEEGKIDRPTKTAYKKFKSENETTLLDFTKSKEYNDLGIARSVTHKRLSKVINGYTTLKGEQIEGLKNNRVKYFKLESERENGE